MVVDERVWKAVGPALVAGRDWWSPALTGLRGPALLGFHIRLLVGAVFLFALNDHKLIILVLEGIICNTSIVCNDISILGLNSLCQCTNYMTGFAHKA